MNHVISFRRPGQVRTLTKLTVPPLEDPVAYARRLEKLGYTIVDISPPLARDDPPTSPDS
jgi:hypothetical protein